MLFVEISHFGQSVTLKWNKLCRFEVKGCSSDLSSDKSAGVGWKKDIFKDLFRAWPECKGSNKPQTIM